MRRRPVLYVLRPDVRGCRSAPVDHLVKFLPVDFAEAVVAARFIETQVGVRHGHTEHLHLRHRVVHEALAKLIVAKTFDLPCQTAGAVWGVVVVGSKHHQRGPPETVDGVLQHLPLGFAALRQRHTGLKTLTLVEAFFFTDFHHRPGIRTVRRTAQRHRFTMAAPSTSQPMTPISAQLRVG